mgnify:CR=1 FL=1
MITNSTLYTPMVFTKDVTKGVVSFLDCFEVWAEKAEKDPEVDLMSVFGMTWEELKKPWNMGNGK